jgi:hypothetical protein
MSASDNDVCARPAPPAPRPESDGEPSWDTICDTLECVVDAPERPVNAPKDLVLLGLIFAKKVLTVGAARHFVAEILTGVRLDLVRIAQRCREMRPAEDFGAWSVYIRAEAPVFMTVSEAEVDAAFVEICK